MKQVYGNGSNTFCFLLVTMVFTVGLVFENNFLTGFSIFSACFAYLTQVLAWNMTNAKSSGRHNEAKTYYSLAHVAYIGAVATLLICILTALVVLSS